MFLDILYNLFVGPIEYIIEIVFGIGNKIAGNPGIAIIGVSLVINFLVLPLYKKSDALQEIEREKQKEMKPWLDHIKKTFKGDERYMMTQTYYRQQGYKPVYALRSSISLLLQIPFFIAAYHFLSNLELLQGASFLCFKNLGEPDQLIPFFFEIRLNLLPILMTAINVISGAIYTRGYPLKEKLQLYIVALVFLVVLYNSPSGLVFYWTLNNLFSLCKNIVMKGINLPERKKKPDPKPIDKKVFLLGSVFIAIFLGALIPLTTMNSSPTEFISNYNTPMTIFAKTLSFYFGLFVVWLSIFYYLASQRVKNIFTYSVWALSLLSVINFYLSGNNFGNMTSFLVYDADIIITGKEKLFGLIITAVIFIIAFIIIKKWQKIAKAALAIMAMAAIALSVWNIVEIQADVNAAYELNENAANSNSKDGIIKLSKTGQNVVVIMLDRAISEYFPAIIEEKPEIAEKLSGFTYYPNTVSYGCSTNLSVPSLFGGYEYTPIEINKRSDETLKDKHNEAVTVLPRIFSDAGFISTACDIPYVGNYKWRQDMSYFEQYGVSGYNTIGAYADDDGKYDSYFKASQDHNFITYSIFRIIPSAFKTVVYDYGEYNSTLKIKGINKDFLNSYSTLANLTSMSEVIESGSTFLMLQNDTTHQPVQLDSNYEPTDEKSTSIDDTSESHYMVNMASILKLCDWIDYLKENGVYDNTKIIICSDHSRNLDSDSRLNFKDIGLKAEIYNPLLLVKDFNSDGFSLSNEFMTLADIPTLATDDIIDNPTNPYTGNLISSDTKYTDPIFICNSRTPGVEEKAGNVFETDDDEWYQIIGDNIFDSSNWKKVTVQ